MGLRRYSAIEIFGVPIDASVGDAKDILNLERLLNNYGVEAQPLPGDITDITPYYWDKNKFRYMLSTTATGSALVELLPAVDGAEALDLLNSNTADALRPSEIRSIEVPKDMDAFVLSGGSPRYSGQLCLHEVIIYDPN